MIPVLDIAKANPRIPLPIMALLRLKTDMPNEVFPSNYNSSRTDRRLDWRTAQNQFYFFYIWSHKRSHLWSGSPSWPQFYGGGTHHVRPWRPPRRTYRGDKIMKTFFWGGKQKTKVTQREQQKYSIFYSDGINLKKWRSKRVTPTRRLCCVHSSSGAPSWLLRLWLLDLLDWRNLLQTFFFHFSGNKDKTFFLMI